MAIIGGILAILAMVVTFALQNDHRDKTGVWGPTRAQMHYIRRKARKAGISENEAYEAWLAHKQRAQVAMPPAALISSSDVTRGRSGCLGWVLLILAIIAAPIVIGSLSSGRGVRAATVDRARVNCRAEPETRAKIAKTFSRGKPVRVVEESDGWSKIDGLECWIRSDLLAVVTGEAK